MSPPMRRLAAFTAPAMIALLGACSSATNENGAPPGADSSTDDVAIMDSGIPTDTGSHDHAAGDTGTSHMDSATEDSQADETGSDAGNPECAPFGAPGVCIDVTACAALGDHSSYPGYCPGAANIQCCIDTPDTTDNPPVPVGWMLMQQSQVTAAMTNWAVAILNDPAMYPMFSTTTMLFGSLLVMARVEWHPPDFQNSVVHRGVTLYEQTD
jgi:hypothetical protein